MPYLKMLWQLDSPTPFTGSWDCWTTSNESYFATIKDPNDPISTRVIEYYQKTNKGIAYFALFKCMRSSELSYGMILLSPLENAVYFKSSQGRYTYTQSFVDDNGIRWYYAFSNHYVYTRDYVVNPQNCILADEYPLTTEGIRQAAQDLLDKIYAVPFHEDYQAGQYVLNRADKGRTVRKVLGLWLAFTTSNYSNPNVQYISDNADTIINDIVTKLSASTDFRIRIYAILDNFGNGIYINVYYGNNVSNVTASIIGKYISRGLEHYSIGATTPQSPFTNLYSLYVIRGTPTITETTVTSYFQTIGIYSTSLYDKDITNMGVDL